MPDATGLVEKMKRAAINAQEAAKPVNVYFGEVVKTGPLEINVEQKMILGEGQLILTRNVTDYEVTAAVGWNTEEEEGTHTHSSPAGVTGNQSKRHTHMVSGEKQLTIHNGLVAGDAVILIRQQEGQKFIVLDRIGL